VSGGHANRVSPPVVLVAQMGCGGDIWEPLLAHLISLNVITYDRPGTGSAAPRPAPNPALPHGAFADELAQLLDERGIRQPAVLVGHSFGALIARAFTATYPDRVAGLVIVDGSIPQFHLMPSSQPKLDGDRPEATEIDVVAGQVEILRAPIPKVPSLILTRAHGTWDGINPPPHPAVEDLWELCQRQLAAQWDTHLLIADVGSHQLQREAPELVAYAIRAVHDAARAGKAVQVDPALVGAARGSIG
jgi:pimeloyl-ACP methyl ester carboxylesterase